MINGTSLVIDSGAQRREHLTANYGCRVVPLTIVLDNDQFHEDDLAPESFYRRLSAGASVSTAAPGPGEVLELYRQAAEEGAEAVLSLHMSAVISGTFNSARIAAQMSPIPVELMDTSASGFAVDMCIETAAKALAGGDDISGAIAAAQVVRARTVNVFVVGQPGMFERGGRSHIVGREISAMSVLATGDGGVRELAKVDDLDGLATTMANHLQECAAERPIWLGVGHAESPGIAKRLTNTLRSSVEVVELVEYDLCLSLVAHLGPGTLLATFCTVD